MPSEYAGPRRSPDPMIKTGMKQVIRQLAKRSSVTQAEAADQIDRYIHEVLQKLRKGQRVPVPGVGVISPGRNSQMMKEPNATASKRNRR
jgi:nucleoid DNA-binding protein